ncbi:MAG TPA: pseudouridine-5'-phosphate glycosidase [Anaeromyxobacteraceae bacterium]|nr:pseudouridine-5'-phosphate glycosidase [Anaeromyxobacteraceae bacterium]
MAHEWLHIAPEVREALESGRAVVALETSVVAQGLPPPANLAAARSCAQAVREAGAVPAFVALLEGRAVLGTDEGALARLADPARRAEKAGVRDLAALLLARRDAGTTVSASLAIAATAGVRLLATGGIGGVHRAGPQDGALRDVSSDLAELSRQPVCVVASGPKIVLDVAATAEELEALGVPVLGYGTSELPAFFVAESGVRLAHRVEDAGQAAALLRQHFDMLARREGVLVCVPPPSSLPKPAVEAGLSEALSEARRRKLSGPALTPFLLEALDRATLGQSRAANVKLLRNNARVAAEIASRLAAG